MKYENTERTNATEHIVQTCTGFVTNPYKTIVREDGSLNYDYHSRTLAFVN